ncbi:MAG TPA: 30S ribosomal protein S12 methylthiotransferase RimO [Candidatus Cloacimonadota bacterium]|nr:30S ribosomal protein S12 methylthiotransferase RimO [Candidatus Cloacimonadota bacterium]
MKTYYIESLGCAKNLVDSEVFAYHLESAGFKPVVLAEDAELILINTCAFLRDSLAEFDYILSDYAEQKKAGTIQHLIVTGCVMNRALEDFKDIFPEVDAWIGLKDFGALDRYLGRKRMTGKAERRPLEDNHFAYLRISDGCENYCSYCTIPSIRGCLASVPIETLVAEAKTLAERGARELIVIAQDTCLYGTDLLRRKALPELIHELHKITAFKWIRVLYLHPDHFDLAWLKLFKHYPRLLPYFEIPIQHSEDKILRAMNRVTGRDGLLRMFETIRKELPEAVLRTTLITGFPGETPADHKHLLDFVSQVPFMHLGVFCFSAEPGTPAYDLPRQVGESTALKRQDEILNLHREQLSAMLETYVGKTIEVLVEAETEPEEASELPLYLCRAWFQSPDIDGVVYASGVKVKPGTFIKVTIDDVIDVDLFATIIMENK